MADKEKETYTGFSNVETVRNFLIPEQLSEGPYGAPRNKYEPVVTKVLPGRKASVMTVHLIMRINHCIKI